jgi:uracil-DNA glycosylase
VADPFVPDDPTSLDELRAAAKDCRGCHLYRDATQTVFGAGPPDTRVVLVGEQPGDIEDRRGEPFVGPAGKLLDRAIVDAGLDRAGAYVTNVVKHFKFTSSAPGKRRIHQTPDRMEIEACRPWLTAELRLLSPDIVVALGATAAKALLGPSFRVTKSRGVIMPWTDPGGTERQILATIHPSAVLRSDDREEAYAGLVNDLTVASRALS